MQRTCGVHACLRRAHTKHQHNHNLRRHTYSVRTAYAQRTCGVLVAYVRRTCSVRAAYALYAWHTSATHAAMTYVNAWWLYIIANALQRLSRDYHGQTFDDSHKTQQQIMNLDWAAARPEVHRFHATKYGERPADVKHLSFNSMV